MIKAILFDLFGTMVAYGEMTEGTRQIWGDIHTILRRLGVNMSFEQFLSDCESRFSAELMSEEDVAQTPFLSKLMRLFAQHGVTIGLDAVAQLAHDCLAVWDDHLYLPEDTIPALRTLRQDYALALVSNYDHPPYVRDLLARHALDDLFDQVTISGDMRIDKPDPRIFYSTLDALGYSPQEAVFVGDDMETDIAGARAGVCHPILIDRRGVYTEYTDMRIRTLAELPALLVEMGAAPADKYVS